MAMFGVDLGSSARSSATSVYLGPRNSTAWSAMLQNSTQQREGHGWAKASYIQYLIVANSPASGGLSCSGRALKLE